MDLKDRYIAVIDSGVGGISVLRHLRQELPGERFLYYGDSANAPYGTRPTDEIRTLTLALAEKLVQRGIKALVVACNTATAAAIEELRRAYPELIVVGIEPALKTAADRFPGGTVGVMATPATLREEKFARLLARCADHCTVVKLPAAGLVELVERGKADSPEAEALLRPLLAPWALKLDALVLGCTHYPFAAKTVSRLLGGKTVLLDGGHGTAIQTRRRLESAGLLRDGPGEIVIENSSNCDKTVALCRELLGSRYESLIFDIDGTLWDSRALVAEGYNLQLRAEGLDHLCVNAEIFKPLFGKVMTEIADVIFASVAAPERYALMVRCMDTENRHLHANPCQIGYPGIRETMEILAKTHRLFIVSNSQRGYPELCIEKLGLADLIRGHKCFGDTGTEKALTIRALMAEHGIESAAYIGDTAGDMEAAQGAGIDFIFAAYGFGDPERYTAKIDSFRELMEVLA